MQPGQWLGQLRGLDAFGRTSDEARIRTNVGALITLLSGCLVVILTLSEFFEYRRVSVEPRLEIDLARDPKIAIRFNVTFPRVPCYLLSLDVVDIVGDMQVDINHDVVKLRLDSQGKVLDNAGDRSLKGEAQRYLEQQRGDPNYCGSCYGADAPPGGCCNTCEEVRDAYIRSSWSFSNPDTIQQCRDEHWTERIRAMNHEGCNIAGEVHANRVVGNLHLSPGRAFQRNSVHTHDLVPYLQGQGDEYHHFGHVIHEFSFGTMNEFRAMRGLSKAQRALKGRSRKQELGIADALEGRQAHPEQSQFMYQYFLKVVPTEYHRLNGQELQTFQYSATAYERDLIPYDPKLGHASPDESDGQVVRTVEGVPGVFFNYEISPMRVTQTETRPSLWHFLSNLCAILGGVLTLAGLIDRLIYRGQKQLGATSSMDDTDKFYHNLDTKLL
ncbi:ER-derived vesicles protein erv46 [Malassezia yamatoensis]|uniref:ER-derived vesicles protein erv46 n=1 Tax=Malassezia yamatoensis TaxID=253288 RepID=A0AAJ5YXG2_9BASI|nr:ER-derived vesicles protein erv46 [Malassezia yamatoensis]